LKASSLKKIDPKLGYRETLFPYYNTLILLGISSNHALHILMVVATLAKVWAPELASLGVKQKLDDLKLNKL
jgi:hypothetical protein